MTAAASIRAGAQGRSISVVRPGCDLAWLRVRLRVRGPTPAQALITARVLAEALPHMPVSGMPLHRRIALLGARLDVGADGHGLLVSVTADPDELPRAVDALSDGLGNQPGGDLLATAVAHVQSWWDWVRHDGEQLADLVADLALHTPPERWPAIRGDVDAALGHAADTPTRSFLDMATETACAHIGPHDRTELIGPLARPNPAGTPAAGSLPPPPRPTRLRLPVVSEGSTLIRLGWYAPARTHVDFAPLSVAARVVGGHYQARLMRAFRHDQGWSYSPWSLLRAGPGHSLWQLATRVPDEHVPATVATARRLVDTADLTEQEVRSATAHTVSELRRLCSSGAGTVSLLGYWQDLGLDAAAERRRWVERLRAVSPGSVAAATRRWLSEEPHLTLTLAAGAAT